MVTIRSRLWTATEYHRMAEAGVFNPQERLELLEGEVLQMAAKNPSHAATNLCAANVLNLALAGQALVRIQDPIALSEVSEPEPDIAVVRPSDRFYADRHPTPAEVFLLVEVADTTLEFDRDRKGPIYARAGITEYWVLAVNAAQVYVFRQPTAEGYGDRRVLSTGDAVQLVAFPEVSIEVARLFP